MRYFLTLAYNGSSFFGWQRQPQQPSVQEALERALSIILRQKIDVTGCGRTDTGVHAKYYVAHFDAENDMPLTFLNGLNSLLPDAIAVFSCQAMHEGAHARFDATERAYEYHIALRKTPFEKGNIWVYPQGNRLDRQLMQEAAALLLRYEAFFPFCKTHSGVEHYRCQIKEARWEWQPENHKMIFHITANRFLRGMVRLIVGACMQAGSSQISVADIQRALDQQTTLLKSWSIPPDGLFLTKINYPYKVLGD